MSTQENRYTALVDAFQIVSNLYMQRCPPDSGTFSGCVKCDFLARVGDRLLQQMLEIDAGEREHTEGVSV